LKSRAPVDSFPFSSVSTIIGLIVIVSIISLLPRIVYGYNDIITILPGASQKDIQSHFDITFYPLSVGKTLGWYNSDDINHNLNISTENGRKVLTKSGTIKPDSTFYYKFDKPGLYHFSSLSYPWMNGSVSVSNDTITTTASHNMKNNVTIQLTQQPSKVKVGQDTHFLITFINQRSKKNQEHIDYVFDIYDTDKSDKQVFKQALHSSHGKEQAKYKFLRPGNYIADITIYYILFSPVNPDSAKFPVHTATR
jgi:hypothetical protein